jgi:hypothetical protein
MLIRPDLKIGEAGSERKVKGTLHWVERDSAVNASARVYGYLFASRTSMESAVSTKTHSRRLII